jgi:replicative DNA helicase
MKKVPIAQKSEAAALSLIAIDRNILSQQTWDSGYFAINANRLVFNALQGVHQRTGVCCPFSAIAELEATGQLEAAGGEEAVHQILSTMKVASGKVCQDMADDYRKHLHRTKAYRDVITLIETEEPSLRTGKTNLKELSETIMKCAEDRTTKVKPVKDLIIEIIDEMEGKVKEEVYTTGLLKLDRALKGGMHKGEMMTVASETGGGKSIYLVQAALANLLEGKSVLFFSLEMNAKDILTRMACNLAGYAIREPEDYKNANQGELTKMNAALLKLHQLPIEIVDGIDNIDEIEAQINRYAGEKRADVIVVDYLQIISCDGDENRESQISEIARRLKVIASQKGSIMLTASQLNDEGRLRESRAIGMHSNQVVYIEHIKDKSRLTIKKNRRGQRNYMTEIIMRGDISRLEEVY